MRILFIFCFLTAFLSLKGVAQSTLFDDSRVSAVYIEINPDSLDFIYTNVLSDHYFKATFIYDYGSGLDTVQNVGFRLRGNTSRFSAKKSFKISFNEYVPGRRYQEVKKINLNGQHNDPTMVREKLFYDSWKNAGMPERRTSFVNLYINHNLYGLYTNLEEFDKDWLQRAFNENDGNMYKCTYPADLVYHGTNQQSYKDIQSSSATGGRAYDLQTNEAEDDYSDLVELITVLNMPADDVFAAAIEQKLNVDGFLKAFAIDVASGNWDDYMYNKNNYFLYHNGLTGKFEFISYDTDNTFGVDWMNVDWASRNCLDWYNHNDQRPLASKILSVPEFNERYMRYLDTVAMEIINPEVIFPHIDSLKALITDAAIADTYRTLDWGYTIADFHNGFTETVDSHTPYGIKPFITTRYTTMLEQLNIASVTEPPTENHLISLFPNPCSDFINIKTKPSSVDRECIIIDMLGRQQEKSSLKIGQTELIIDISNLQPGVYSLVISDQLKFILQRFVKH